MVVDSKRSDWKQALLELGTTPLYQAIRTLNDSHQRIVLVVDSSRRLLGVLSDGDVRKAVLRGCTIREPLENCMNSDPVTLSVNSTEEEIRALFKQSGVYRIPVVDREGRVCGLKYIEEASFAKEKSNAIVIMAGGLGERMRPLTDKTPKPMLPVGERPILETVIRRCRSAGFRKFYLCVNYLAEVIKEHFGDGSRLGVEITYIHENQRMGTAGALNLLPRMEEDFIVMNGDLLTNIDFGALLEYHMKEKAAATISVKHYEVQIPFGVVNAAEGKILNIEEKPVQEFSVNAGIYCINPRMLDLIPAQSFYNMPTLFKNAIDAGIPTRIFPIHEYWMDIGKVEDYLRAQQDYATVFGHESSRDLD